jgi:hypothetical protein
MNLLLDTHAVLWFYLGDPQLSGPGDLLGDRHQDQYREICPRPAVRRLLAECHRRERVPDPPHSTAPYGIIDDHAVSPPGSVRSAHHRPGADRGDVRGERGLDHRRLQRSADLVKNGSYCQTRTFICRPGDGSHPNRPRVVLLDISGNGRSSPAQRRRRLE